MGEVKKKETPLITQRTFTHRYPTSGWAPLGLYESIVISLTGNELKTQEMASSRLGKIIKIKPSLDSFEKSNEFPVAVSG